MGQSRIISTNMIAWGTQSTMAIAPVAESLRELSPLSCSDMPEGLAALAPAERNRW